MVIFIASVFIMSKHILNHRCECMCLWVASGIGKPSASYVCQRILPSWKNTVRGLSSVWQPWKNYFPERLFLLPSNVALM